MVFSLLESDFPLKTINGFNSETQSIGYGLTQWPVLGSLLFLIYISEFHNAKKFSQPFHFADDTCQLNIPSKISKTNKSLKKVFKEL